MKNFLLLTLFSAVPAQAQDICAPLASLQAQVNYCDENTAYVKPAQTCRDQFAARIKAENQKLSKVLAAVQKNGNTEAQAGDLQVNETSLAETLATLSDLIAQGNKVLAEVEAYQEDFVLPIYAGYEEDFAINPHSAEGQEIFRDKECYGEPMADLDDVRAKVGKMVKDIEQTREKTEQLSLVTKAREQGLDQSSSVASKVKTSYGKGSSARFPAERRGKKSSTVTGVEQAKQKEKKLDE